MSIQLDPCFDNIIGLSRTDCPCYDADKPIEASVSDSGLYLDELEGLSLNMVQSDNDCEGLWDILIKARQQAISCAKTDLLTCISSNSALRRKPFSGIAGEWHEAFKLKDKKTYAGAVMQFASIAGGYMRIKRIGTKFNATGTITVDVYDLLSNTSIAQFVLETEADTVKWNTVNFQLDDLSRVDGVNKQYYFIYSTTMKPYNTAASCGCGNTKPTWNTANPCYNFVPHIDYGWAAFMMLGGATGNVLSERLKWPAGSETYGLVFDVEFGCKTEQTLCNGSLDYQSDPYAITLAHAVRYKAGELIMTYIRAKAHPNYYSLVIPEMMQELQNRYRAEYENRIFNYLCPALSEEENINRYSDCYTCKDSYGFRLVGIWK